MLLYPQNFNAPYQTCFRENIQHIPHEPHIKSGVVINFEFVSLAYLIKMELFLIAGPYRGIRETNKVDRAKCKHWMCSERAVALTPVVCRLSRQRACTQPCLQAGYCQSTVCFHLDLSTLFVSHCT
jgi:hypothetical protein